MALTEPPTTPAALPVTDPPETPADSAAYRPSHGGLVRELAAFATTTVSGRGGIVVPAYRPFRRQPGLRLAVRLAEHTGWDLVVICSGLAKAAEFPDELRTVPAERLVVRDLAEMPSPAVDLASLRDPLVRLERCNDAAAKRNLGIVLAVRAGWRYLLFLDDDVIPDEDGPTLDEKGIDFAVASLESAAQLRAISWPVLDFPDNSVVGHARRLARRPQEIFLGSAGLLVRSDGQLPFFPGVYNEDWMFLIALAQDADRHDGCLARAGTVRQLRYDPFSTARAMSEEPGDIIAEGLMNLLEDDGPGLWATAGRPDYWRRAMARRARLLDELIQALHRRRRDDDPWRAYRALRAAKRLHDRTSPQALCEYVQAWHDDLPRWRSYLSGLRREADRLDPADGAAHP